MRHETRGRILAFQALYQCDVRGTASIEEMGEFLRAATGDEEALAYAEELVRGCVKRRDELDARIGEAAEHWDVSRMALVDRAVLRVAAYELLRRPDVPPKVAVNEAVKLAKKYGSAESGAFVNGILDRLMRAHRPPEAASRRGAGR